METPETTRAIDRRTALKLGVLGAGALVLSDWRVAWAAQGPAPAASAAAAPSAAKAAKAKAIIQIWMWGGPCQLDTFDPKPEAGRDYCGPLDKPIETNVPGIRICQLLPLLAKQADKYAIIRSMTHDSNSHETASYIVQTGHEPGGGVVFPCVGAVVSLFKGYDHGYKGLIPPYIVVTQPLGRFFEVGFLGSMHKPFATGGDPNQKVFAVEGIIAPGMTEQRQMSRRDLVHETDTLGKAMPTDASFQQFDHCGDKAYDLILGDAGKVFDLTQEKDDLRTQYGHSTFGQSCLVARRLVERGVPYVAINYGGWDTHKRHFETMRQKLPEMDRGMATLLQDLSDHGLLDSTIVWWGGEFGRTPKVMWEEPWNGGRGHYGRCFSVVVAGGGFKGGRVVGASDAKGETVAERPVHPEDLIGSMYELMGIDPDGPMPNARGLSVPMLPPAEQGPGKGRLTEIM